MNGMDDVLREVLNVPESLEDITNLLCKDRLLEVVNDIKKDSVLQDLEREQSKIFKKLKQDGKEDLLDEQSDLDSIKSEDYLQIMYKNAFFDGFRIMTKED